MPVDKLFSYLLPHTPVNITSCRHACTSHLTFVSAPTPGPGPVSKPADILPLTGADGSFIRSTRWQGAKCRKDYKIERSFLWVVRPVSWGRPSLLIISPPPHTHTLTSLLSRVDSWRSKEGEGADIETDRCPHHMDINVHWTALLQDKCKVCKSKVLLDVSMSTSGTMGPTVNCSSTSAASL